MSVDIATQVRKQLRPKYVYFARVGEYLKVGCSYDPQQRIKQIRQDGCTKPVDLDQHAPAELLAALPAGTSRDAFTTEGNYFFSLADYHVVGEWFRAVPEVIEWIASLDPALAPWEQSPITST